MHSDISYFERVTLDVLIANSFEILIHLRP
jgi:hypothetical protein